MSDLSALFRFHGRDGRDVLQCSADFSNPLDLSVTVCNMNSGLLDNEQKTARRCLPVSAFGLPPAHIGPIELGGWVGSTSKGSSVNCDALNFCAHSSGTHTECVGHIMDNGPTIDSLVTQFGLCPMLALLLTVVPQRLGDSGENYVSQKSSPDDLVVTRSALKNAFHAVETKLKTDLAESRSETDNLGSPDVTQFIKAVLIRTLHSKDDLKFTGTNPPYLTFEAASYIVGELKAANVVVDLPSVDREDDGGVLAAHRTIFQYNLPIEKDDQGVHVTNRASAERKKQNGEKLFSENAIYTMRTVTELANFPLNSNISDGLCLLNLQVAPISSDAAPSRPVVYQVNEIDLIHK